MRRLRRLVTFERERRVDNLRTRGDRADLYVGPFRFYAVTADEGWIAFEVVVPILRWKIGWEWSGYPEDWAGA